MSSLLGVRSVIRAETSAINVDGSSFVFKSEAASPWSGSPALRPSAAVFESGGLQKGPSLSVLPKPLHSRATHMAFCIQVPCMLFVFCAIFTF